MPSRHDLSRRVAMGMAVIIALGVGALGWASTLLGEYSVMDMGGGHAGHVHGSGTGTGVPATGVSVTELIADPLRPPDVRVELIARKQTIQVPGGHPVEGYTVNGTSPGPTIRARQGSLVEAVFVNESVPAGATLHWHGIDVANAADGVAGVTQDAVPVGGRQVYRFVAADSGTYWYHSHQVSHEQVEGGLLGAVVIEPAEQPARAFDTDVLALLHVYGGQHTLNGRVQDEQVAAEPGSTVRIRIINTDQGTAAVWSAAPFLVVSVDGHDVNAPAMVEGRTVLIPAGGRADIAVQAPAQGSVRLQVGGARSISVGDPAVAAPPARQPAETLDLLSYGDPAPLDFDPQSPDRTFDYVIGRRFGLIDGRPGNFWTINGQLFPDVPMFHVREGDVVLMRLVNETGEVHPMHLHGHHFLVLSRGGEHASGSPWWADSLDVRPAESYQIAFVADNPGIWSDHCHTLAHAVDGLVAHVMYEGVSTPFTINGAAGNQPE
ncbi:FtsP/CotA-like multicopper oxidase with cupredoxin domain [Arthrobacter pascens]|uniref:multicopper oxidase family protein n=1 Tax=Arthrobacter pascens TaxID=1677 RepID=UPI0027868248|nr:multicopper oxidase family protein [Arthrobacter pascens]MDQ0632928.1 FtsP/CotA-like multicopper oxidase with cupredoxin domain [Arthrobacter pascens]